MNPDEKKILPTCKSIDEIHLGFKWIKGFNGEAFVDQVKREWQMIFDYLEKEQLLTQHFPVYWRKKTNTLFTAERAVSQIISYHYKAVKSGDPSYMDDPLFYVMEQMTFSNFFYETVTAILFMMLSESTLK